MTEPIDDGHTCPGPKRPFLSGVSGKCRYSWCRLTRLVSDPRAPSFPPSRTAVGLVCQCSEALLHLRLHFSTFVAFNKAALLGKLKAVLL